MKLFAFKKMSTKIAFVVVAAVILVGGAAVAYMQTRIIAEIDNGARLYAQLKLMQTSDRIDLAFAEGKETSYIENLVQQTVLYDTGFTVMADAGGVFFNTNDFISRLNSNDRNALIRSAELNRGTAFDITLNNNAFLAAQFTLHNGYSLFALAPRSEAMAEVSASLMRFAVIFAVVVIILVFIGKFIGKKMAAPLVSLNALMKRAGTTGEIMISDEEAHTLNEYKENKDEIGQCIVSAIDLFKHIGNISRKLETLASGDLTIEHEMLSEKDPLGSSVAHIVENLNEIFESIQSTTGHVSSGAKQIADGAQHLAQGTTQQAATIQELSAAISEISEKTNDNAKMAGRAAVLAGEIIENAEKGSRQMDSMMSAVKEINDASQSISKVIKVIDDIAFQTNILALNAAVEAARAGQNGKGFAVVAEEVRNLAAKSAEAAKNTGDLIANSMEKAKLGAKIAEDTAASLGEIVVGINESNNLIEDIAKSSEEQSFGISQINSSIEQVSQGVSQNSATAEQSAAASQQMSGQSDDLQQMIRQFKLKNNQLRLSGGKY